MSDSLVVAPVQAIVTLLTGNTALRALVGYRVSPAPMPQGETMPAVTYQFVTTLPYYTQSGYSGFSTPRFQFDCWAASYAGMLAVANALIVACHSTLVAGRALQGMVESISDSYEPDLKLFRMSVDVRFRHKES